MINLDNLVTVTTTFAPKNLPKHRQVCKRQCDRVSSHRYNVVLSDVKDEFEESKTIQIMTGSDPSVTAANVFDW